MLLNNLARCAVASVPSVIRYKFARVAKEQLRPLHARKLFLGPGVAAFMLSDAHHVQGLWHPHSAFADLANGMGPSGTVFESRIATQHSARRNSALTVDELLSKTINKVEDLQLVADYKGDSIETEQASWAHEQARIFVGAMEGWPRVVA